MTTGMRVADKDNSKGSKSMVLATRVAGERTAMVTKRAMLIKMREAGEEEGNSLGGWSDGDGKEDGDGKQR
jgi:hypothetical protein